MDSQPGRLRLLESGDEMTRATLITAAAGETLAADGLTYRGYLEVRSGEAGLTVINVLDIEDYLRGVVPNELSPSAFPGPRGAEGPGRRRAHLRPPQPRPVRGQGVRHLRDADLPGLRGTVHRAPALRPRGGRDPRHRRLPPRQPDQRALHLDLRRPHRDGSQHLRRRAHARISSACPAARSARPGARSAPRRGRRRWGTRPASTGTSRCWPPSASWSPRMYATPAVRGRPPRASCATGRRGS